MLIEDEQWPATVASLRCISQHENRSIREWTIGDRRLLFKCLESSDDQTEARLSEERSLFRAEYLLLKRLRHPNLVNVVGFRTMADGTLVIAMDAAPGSSLGSLAIDPGWTPAKASIARQLLAGLDAIHRLGFVHADLKPDHVFIDAIATDPRVTLLDLGLATRQGETVVRGTPGWIPPEILNRSVWTVQSDLYLFGLILYHLAYGKSLDPGNRGENAGDESIPRAQDVPNQLSGIIHRLIAKSPERRPASARAVWEELREIRPTKTADTPDSTLCSRSHAFHGREREIDAFSSWLSALSQISGSLIATCRVQGEAGIGKSALIEHLVARAETMGWNPCAPPGNPIEPIKAMLRHPSSGSVVELRERSESAETVLALLPDEERADPPLHHEINLKAVSPLVAMRIVEDKLEQPDLVKRVAILSLGNPRLLVSFCETIDWLTEFAWREFQDAVQERAPEGGAPHPACLDWLQAHGRPHPRSLEALALVSLLQWWTPEAIEEAIGRSWSTVIADLAGFYERGLVIDYHDQPKLLSRSWERAAILSSTGARDAVRLLLQRIGHVGSVAKLTALTELAIALELWPEVGHVFDKAMRAMLVEGRHVEAAVFLYKTYNALPEDMDVATPELWQLFSGIVCYCNGSSWFVLPTRLADRLPASIPTALRPMLHAFFLVDARRKPEARQALGSLKSFPDEVPTSVAWIATYLKSHLRSDLGEEIVPKMRSRLEGWLEHPRFRNAADQYALRYLYHLNFFELSTPSEWLQILEGMEDDPEHAPWKEALRRLDLAGVYFHLGRLAEAQHHAEFALNALHTMTSDPRLLRALQTSAAIAYELGDFPRAHQLGRRMARVCLLSGLLVDCAWQIRNLSLVDLARGQLGMALADYRTAEELHRAGQLVADDPRRTWVSAWLRWEAGDPTEIRGIAAGHEGLPVSYQNQRALGLDELASGCLESGRTGLRAAVKGFADNGRHTEAADTLARWLEMEADLDHRSQAEELLLELARCSDGMTPRIHVHIRVTEANMLVLGWIEPSEDLEWSLLRLVEDLHRREFHSLSWRSLHYLARFYHEDDQFEEAAHYYNAALRSLRDLMATLESDEQRKEFRNRPGPRRLLSEATSRYPETSP